MTRPRRLKSTIDRALRLTVRTLDLVAPPLAVRWALRIWCTPPHPRTRRAEASDVAAPGTRSTVWLRGAGQVAVESWGDGDGPITYLVHGWAGWRSQLAELVAPLVAAGHRVVALDMPGHGESGPGRLGGRRGHLQEMADALVAVVAATGPAYAIVAHSGGAGAAAAALRDGLAVERLVFIAPPADPISYALMFARLLGLGERSRHRFLRRIERVTGRDLTDFDVPTWAARAAPEQLPRLLVMHDRHDRVTRYADGEAITAASPGATLRTTEGLGHRRILAAQDVIAETVSFVTAGLTVTAAGSTPRS